MKRAYVMVMLLCGACGVIPGTSANLERDARARLVPALLDAESARFQSVRAARAGGVRGYVNAKNGFGAYAGFIRFIATNDVVAVEPPLREGDPDARAAHRAFREVWRQEC